LTPCIKKGGRILCRGYTLETAKLAVIEHDTKAAGYYIAGVYREKASGARAERPELLRMICDLQREESERS
jgi:DNA invertase Pin-like site-specific DNA recombinase